MSHNRKVVMPKVDKNLSAYGSSIYCLEAQRQMPNKSQKGTTSGTGNSNHSGAILFRAMASEVPRQRGRTGTAASYMITAHTETRGAIQLRGRGAFEDSYNDDLDAVYRQYYMTTMRSRMRFAMQRTSRGTRKFPSSLFVMAFRSVLSMIFTSLALVIKVNRRTYAVERWLGECHTVQSSCTLSDQPTVSAARYWYILRPKYIAPITFHFKRLCP